MALLPTSLSHRAIVVYLMFLDLMFPIPFPLHPSSSIPVFVLVFCCIIFLSVLCFLGYFAVSADLLRAGFAALRPLLGFFPSPTVTSFHCTLLCMGSMYT
jgi:hypothetical protein